MNRSEQMSATPRRRRDKAYKALVIKISQSMSEKDVESLKFVADLSMTDGSKPTAITVLQKLREDGHFSPNSCANLHARLTEINRHDLAGYVQQYMDDHPPQDTTVLPESLTHESHSANRLPPISTMSGFRSPSSAAAPEEYAVCRGTETMQFVETSQSQQGSQALLSQSFPSLMSTPRSTEGSPAQIIHNWGIVNISDSSNSNQSSLSPQNGPLVRRRSISPNPATHHQPVLQKAPSQTDMQWQNNREKERHETPMSQEHAEGGPGSLIASGTSITPTTISPLPKENSLVQRKPQCPAGPQESSKEGCNWKTKLLRSRGTKAKKSMPLTTQETSWSIKKAPLAMIIWNPENRLHFKKCPSELPINIGLGELNPRLSFLLYPFGLFKDSGSSMTLLVKLHIPDECPPLAPTEAFNLTWETYTQGAGTTGERLTHSKKPCEIKFSQGTSYIHKLLPHDKIKRCECQTFAIHVKTSYLLQNASSAKVQDTECGITPEQTENLVTMPKLLKFRTGDGGHIDIAKSVGPRYDRLGHHLLEEDWADTIIKKVTENSLNNRQDSSEIGKKILKHWMEGEGAARGSVRWETLIEALRAADMTELATTIEQNLQLNYDP